MRDSAEPNSPQAKRRLPPRVQAAVALLRSEGVSEDNPITPENALRYRGIGPWTLPFLEESGLVRFDDFADLPARIANLVKRAGFRNRAELIAGIERGWFFWNGDHCCYRTGADTGFRYLRNCGPVMFNQIRAWAGFDAIMPDAEADRESEDDD